MIGFFSTKKIRQTEKNNFLFWAILAAIFFVLAIIITYPLFTNFSKGVLGPPPLEDHRIYLWEIGHFGERIFSAFKNPLVADDIFFPRGLRYQDMNFSLSAILVSPIGYFLKNPTFAYNLWVIFGYIVSGLFTFLLAERLTKNKYAAFLASVIFTFSPFHYQVVYNGQLESSGIFWIPLLLYCLILFLEKKNIFGGILLSLIFSLTALSSAYFGAFSILLIAVFSFLYFLFKKNEIQTWRNKGLRQLSRIALPPLAIALIILLPFYLSLYRSDRIITESGFNVFLASFKTETDGSVADIVDYVTPLPFYYKDFGFGYRNWNLWPANSYYISFLLLPALLIYFFRKNKRRIEKIIFYSFLALFILSMGSSLRYDHELVKPFGLGYVPLPGSILHLIPVVSDARVIARLGIFVNLLASLLIGFMFLPLFSEKFGVKTKFIFLSVLTLFFFLETYAYVIPSKIKPSVAPKIYETVAKAKGDFSIVEYPLRIAAAYPFNEEELFYQTIHKKKTVFGFAPFRSKSLEEHLGKFGSFSQKTGDFRIDREYLKKANVRYFLVNRQKINGLFPDEKDAVYEKITCEIKSIPGISFRKNIEGIDLYELKN